ncbi:cytochrome P450 [Canariomyces notabilis]|uniref:Cytochrome P450 n=1 Tax=Canariomyces notabilis TaxID=2074819 RepID=A0AAN6YTL7_9PEZI|nr:cytochrome P450 [Canariomyces arenarius]
MDFTQVHAQLAQARAGLVDYISRLPEQEPRVLTWNIVSAASVALLVYWTGLIIYRLTLHPLARFPGPFLCRISDLQQCYYEAILNGKFIEQLPKYHRKYGPIVRINPNEVHIDDPAVFHEIYKQNTPFTKDPKSYGLGVSQAMAFTSPVEKHRVKRQALDPAFSKRRVNMMEDGLYEELEKVFDRIDGYEKRDEEVPISELYYCYTGDIISRYLFGKSLGLISAPDFLERAEQMRSFTRGVWISIHFQFIRDTMLAMPRWITSFLNDAWVKVLWFCEDLAKNAIANFDAAESSEKLSKPGQETIFDRLLSDNDRRRQKGQEAHPLTFRELADESVAILNAGTEPTATMMVYATYFFLRYPEVQERILKELSTVQRDEKGRLPLVKVESLPYFTGFVRETLRYVPLVPGRLPRVVPKGGLYVPAARDTIPEGAVVGIDHMPLHWNQDIFERPSEFDPGRWLGEAGKELNHWLLSFSKGRTDCIGKNLAYAEMHLVLANLFSRYQLELTPGSDEAMVWLDRVIVHPAKNLRIKVRARNLEAVA